MHLPLVLLSVYQCAYRNPKDAIRSQVDTLLRGVTRVLTAQGRYVQISFGQPHFRKRNYFVRDTYGWSVTHQTFGSGLGYFCYTMKKGTPLPDDIDDEPSPSSSSSTTTSESDAKSNITASATTSVTAVTTATATALS
jgi:ubiquinone/menaquinone biosynthesis C-methylase UbiE